MKSKLYNKERADELMTEFSNLTGLNIDDRSRITSKVMFRALLYKVLRDLNGMSNEMISDFFATKNVSRHRTSICHALTKIDVYYNSYLQFREAYDVYFKDKKEKYEKKEAAKINRANRRKQKANEYHIRKNGDELDVLIASLPEDKRKEIYEMVNLRVKSWSWKSKNNYEIIECGTSMEDMCW